jgi:hypothetical protein
MDALLARLRRPLPWMVLGEVLLVTGFLAAAWHVWQDAQRPSPAVAPAQAPRTRAPATSPPAGTSAPAPSRSPASPPPGGGVRTDPAFIDQQLSVLNKDESAFESAEWQLTRAVVDWSRRYLEQVVLPQVRAAAGAGRPRATGSVNPTTRPGGNMHSMIRIQPVDTDDRAAVT